MGVRETQIRLLVRKRQFFNGCQDSKGCGRVGERYYRRFCEDAGACWDGLGGEETGTAGFDGRLEGEHGGKCWLVVFLRCRVIWAPCGRAGSKRSQVKVMDTFLLGFT